MKLQKHRPDFTKGDLRYALMFGLHFDSEVIQKINNTTESAVKKAKYRLRKKFDLSSDKSVEDYLYKLLRKELKP